MSDIWTSLQRRLRTSAATPLVTYVDGATNERTELSTASLANAAAKIANALRDEFDLDPGARVALDLPLHWQRSIWCAGVWTAGCIVMLGRQEADLIVTTPQGAESAGTGTSTVVAVSMHPFGLPITDALPHSVEDVTLAVRQQPDAYLFDVPSPDSPALALDGDLLTQAQLLHTAQELAQRCDLQPGGRLLLSHDAPHADQWLGCLATPLAVDASVVLLHNGHDVRERVVQQEQVTAFCP